MFQGTVYGTDSNMDMLSLAVAVGDDMRAYGVNEKDLQGSSPLLLACRPGNFDIAEMLVVGVAGVSVANDNPLLYSFGGWANSSALRCSSARVRMCQQGFECVGGQEG